MKLTEIFAKEVDRPIDGVIKADDAEHVALEVEEYVLTNEAARELEKLLEEYTDYSSANGVWISGFFGSGKSHMLKMLAHLLGDVDGQMFPREKVSESFRAKSEGAILPALIGKADKILAKSLLFNIDQKATVITKDQTDALLKVFVKVFDDARGYFGNQGHVARFERDLEREGHYVAFKDAFERITGKTWIEGRKGYIFSGRQIDQAYAEAVGGETPTEILKKYSDDYAVSIEDFADEVVAWLEQKPENFHLNFFVDEVGQFIGDDTKLMLNLQTIAETLNTKAKGRSWVFVTSQEDMDKVIGDQTKRQAQDFSKIQGRFKTRVKLTSTNVDEVIRKRLLEKNDTGVTLLSTLYAEQSANFKTLFDFADGSRSYKTYPSEELFVGTYPFVTYQFSLFQQSIEGLSEHNAFEGKNSSVGERSMLGVVQQVASTLAKQDVGTLASFDQMFEGIRASLKAAPQKQVLQAEQLLDERPIAIRLLKALFLVKYVEGFKATVRNLSVLVYDRFGLDLPALQEQVRDALAVLEQNTYIQRTGDTYSYLTNEEQDIEKEIKSVEVDLSEVSDFFFTRLLHQGVMKQQSKFRYAVTNQDFPLGYMVDDIPKGQPKELTLHFITPANVNELDNIRLQGAGKAELRVVLGADTRLMSDLMLLLKTSKYVKQKQGSATTDSVARILEQKRQESASREKDLTERTRDAVATAKLLHNTVELSSSSTVAETRIAEGLGVLVTKTYPQLVMLGGSTFPEADVEKYLQSDDGALSGLAGRLGIPGEELYKMGVLAKDKLGELVTVKKLVDQFSLKPNGWDYGSILCVIAFLYGQGKITLELDNVLLKRTEIAKELRNAQKHGSLVVRKQATYDHGKVKAFSDFIKEFFDEPNPSKDPTELAQHGADLLKAKHDQLTTLAATSRYPFTVAVQPAIDLLASLIGRAPNWYVTEFAGGDELIEQKSDVLVPVDQFLNGPQAKTYDDARRFLTEAAVNLAYLHGSEATEAEALLADPGIFRGNKANKLKTLVDELRSKLSALVGEERTKAAATILQRRAMLAETSVYAAAPVDAQQEALATIDLLIRVVEQQSSIAELRLAPSYFVSTEFPRLLQQLKDAGTPPTDEADDETPASGVTFRAIGSITVIGGKDVLATADDVDEYVEALRTALKAAMLDGAQITR